MRKTRVPSVAVVLVAGLLSTSVAVADVVDDLARDLGAKNPETRLAAVTELSQLGPLAADAVPELVDALKVDDLAFQHEVVITLGRIGPDAAPAVSALAKLLGGESKILEHSAIHALRMIGPAAEEAVPKLTRLARSRDPNVAVPAAWALAVIAPENEDTLEGLIPRLIDALDNDSQDVRNDAVMALAAIGEPAVQPLADEIGVKGPVVCWHAADALAAMGSVAGPAVDKLVGALDDKDERVCWHAARALGAIGGEPNKVVPALVEKLDAKGPLREHAALALASFGPDAEPAVPKLIEMLSDENVNTRIIAARALGAIGPGAEEAVPALDEALDDEVGAVTFAAAEALGQIGKAAVPVLRKRLQNEDYRQLAASVLGTVGPDAVSAVPELLTLLESKEREVRVDALLAIANIGPAAREAAAPTLFERLDNPRDESRAGAIYALTKLEAPGLVPILIELLPKEKDPKVKFAAAWSLVMIEPQNPDHVAIALPLLTLALGDDWSLIQREALHTLTEIGTDPERFVGPAVEMLDASNPVVRNTAIYSLGTAGPAAKETVPRLETIFAEATYDQLAKMLTAWALVRIDPSPKHVEQAIPLLADAVRRAPQRETRIEAAKTLGEIGEGSPAAVEALRQAAEDDDQQLREAARKALDRIGG